MKRLVLLTVLVAVFASVAMAQTGVTREDVAGITNFARIETTVACAGAITPDSVTAIRDMGFGSIINLRRATEQGANVDAEAAAANAAGIKYVHLPFGGPDLDPGVADQFLRVITEPDTEPAFIHCAGGGRAATMWFIKRVMVDRWDTDRALAEAADLGLTAERLRTFALEYLQTRAN